MNLAKKIALSALVIVAFVAQSVRAHFFTPAPATLADRQSIKRTPKASTGTKSENQTKPAETPAPAPAPTPTPTPTSTPTPAPAPKPKPAGQYKDGTYNGPVVDATYGNVQVQIVVSGGRIADVNTLQYPNTHQYSKQVNPGAVATLEQETISAQSASIASYSGASYTSNAFRNSVGAAINQARN